MYLIGAFIAFILYLIYFFDISKKLNLCDVFIALFCSIFSWILVALIVLHYGNKIYQKIKEKNHDKIWMIQK